MIFVNRVFLQATILPVIILFVSICQLKAQNVTTFEANGRTGLKNEQGVIIVQPKYLSIGEFIEGLAVVSTMKDWENEESYGSNFYGFIDITGKEVIPLIYESAKDFNQGLAIVSLTIKEKGDKDFFGFIDKTGKEIIPFKYSGTNGAREFSEGLAAVEVRVDAETHLWGFIDKTGKEIVAPKYYNVEDFTEGMSRVILKPLGKLGFINKVGSLVVALKYDCGSGYSEGLAAVGVISNNSCNYIFIDKLGKTVISTKYDEAGPFSEGISVVGIGNDENGFKFGLINKAGKVLLPIIYDNIFREDKNKSVVYVKDTKFYVDNLGQVIK